MTLKSFHISCHNSSIFITNLYIIYIELFNLLKHLKFQSKALISLSVIPFNSNEENQSVYSQKILILHIVYHDFPLMLP